MLFTTNTSQNNGRPSPDTHSQHHKIMILLITIFYFMFLSLSISVFICVDVVHRAVRLSIFIQWHTESAHPSSRGHDTYIHSQKRHTFIFQTYTYVCHANDKKKRSTMFLCFFVRDHNFMSPFSLYHTKRFNTTTYTYTLTYHVHVHIPN